MYKRHKWLIAVIFVTVFIVAAFLKADYSEIAESSISVMAIAIAVYIGATSVILGSAYAEKMKSQVDPEIRTSSSLGVLASYLRTAGAFGIGRPGVKFCVSDIRQSQEWHWKVGRILA